MGNQIVDIFTSKEQIGSVYEIYVYVRFPFYLAGHVKSLAIGVSESSVGSHSFRASISYEGRAKVHHGPPRLNSGTFALVEGVYQNSQQKNLPGPTGS